MNLRVLEKCLKVLPYRARSTPSCRFRICEFMVVKVRVSVVSWMSIYKYSALTTSYVLYRLYIVRSEILSFVYLSSKKIREAPSENRTLQKNRQCFVHFTLALHRFPIHQVCYKFSNSSRLSGRCTKSNADHEKLIFKDIAKKC